ncbi:MAG: lytic transglycosylase domain-containing protein [Burkholderiaceae bacterium]|nr:lytic transglycosylase domain-containing protein [Burkholderiaceae bacterium]
MKYKNKWLAILMLALASAAPWAQAAHARKNAVVAMTDDETFVALREASRDDDADKAERLAARLGSYAIPSYVEYYRLRPQLFDVPASEIRDFLTRYDGSAIADRLRNDWLLVLGFSQDWKNFDEQYAQFVQNDDRQVKCYALLSQVAKGQNVAPAARQLLTAPKEYGEACPALIKTLMQNGQFNQDDLDMQVRLAAESVPSNVVRRIAAAGGTPDELLEKAVDKPAYVLKRGAGKTHERRQVFIIALGRVAKADVDTAVDALNEAAKHLNAGEQAQAWAEIALAASFKLDPEVLDYWHKSEGAALSLNEHQWKARSALRAGDWQAVARNIDAMPEKLRSDPTWIYWLGRAEKATGREAEAQQQFLSIANQTSFYGQLAWEELGRKIAVPPRPQPLSEAEIASMADNAGFRRALKLLDLNLRLEGYREWNWELRNMSERQQLAAAEFARRSNVLDRMVSTSEHTRNEIDFSQRYPTPYDELVHPATGNLGLDRAWVYGLVRQESRFILNARSYVGAQGFMQIMPGTAKYVARKIGMEGYSAGKAGEIDTNIALGTNYLNLILNDLDGSQVLATAAYNAGPGRPRNWRASLAGPVEGAIFTESIPFNETREYVRNVLANATCYAAIFENKPQSLKARLGIIAPKGYVVNELP